MKTTLSFLAIVAISIGCVFSSCQSKVNNPSHNELDSTKTSVEEVDSAAIIAQQKQKEAEKAAEDFKDIWWIGDYSDENSGDSAGFIAIKIMNALSTGGFKIKSDDKSKGNFDFEYTGHYSIKNAETVPYEVYIKTGEAA